MSTDTKKPTRKSAKQQQADADEVVRAASRGDDEALDKLRSVLDDHPQLWQDAEDLSVATQRMIISEIAGGNHAYAEVVKRRAESMRDELTGPIPRPVLKLAADRVVACWLQVQHLDAVCTRLAQNNNASNFWLRAQQQADRRYSKALKVLDQLIPKPQRRRVPKPKVKDDKHRRPTATQLLPAPVITAPGTTVEEPSVCFRWEAVEGANGYGVVLSDMQSNGLVPLLDDQGRRWDCRAAMTVQGTSVRSTDVKIGRYLFVVWPLMSEDQDRNGEALATAQGASARLEFEVISQPTQ